MTASAAPKPASQRTIVSVSLIDRAVPARLWLSDLQCLDALGLSRRWYLAGNSGSKSYVSARIDGFPGLRRVARLILDEARPGTLVRYRDGDPRNLCRDNLYVVDDPNGSSPKMMVMRDAPQLPAASLPAAAA